MPAYIIVQIEVTDPAGYDDYKKIVPASLAAYGGKFAVRGGRYSSDAHHCLARSTLGNLSTTTRLGCHEPSSVSHAPAKALRQRTAKTEMIVVKGAT